jgi:glutamyl-tRNA reductase
VYLFNIDDLQQIANDYMQQRREEMAKCQAIIQERAGTLLDGLRRAASASAPQSPEFGGCSAAMQV